MYYRKFEGFVMRICYDKLFHMMIDRRRTTSQLMKMCGFSANIVVRLKRIGYISMESYAENWTVSRMAYLP